MLILPFLSTAPLISTHPSAVIPGSQRVIQSWSSDSLLSLFLPKNLSELVLLKASSFTLPLQKEILVSPAYPRALWGGKLASGGQGYMCGLGMFGFSSDKWLDMCRVIQRGLR